MERLNRARVVSAAASILEDKGQRGLTMRTVAARLGVDPMALYRHVSGKADLEAGIADQLLVDFPLPDAGSPWRARLVQLANAYRAMAVARPAAFEIYFSHPHELRSEAPLLRTIDEALREAGVPVASLAAARRLYVNVVAIYALDDASKWPSAQLARSPDRDREFAYALDHVLDGFGSDGTGS